MSSTLTTLDTSQFEPPAQTRIARVITPAPPDRWRKMYDADPEAVPYQSPSWIEAIYRDGKHKDISR